MLDLHYTYWTAEKTGLISNILQRPYKHKLAHTHTLTNKTTCWRTVSIYTNICSMSIMSKEQTRKWTQRPLHTLLKHTLFLSQDSYWDHAHSQLFVWWLQKCYTNTIMQEASFPRQMLAVGFITVIMCFLLLCLFSITSVPFLSCQT